MNQKHSRNDERMLPDEAIIDLYWSRNEQAISETDKKYGKYLFGIAYNILHGRLDSEECVNDTYLGTWNRIPPTKPQVFPTFLARIMRNIAIDRYRKNRAKGRVPSELTVSLDELDECMACGESVEEERAMGELVRLINTFLRSRTEREEFMFICRYYYADEVASIARMLDVSDKTVYRDLSQLRRDLKEILEKEGYLREE